MVSLARKEIWFRGIFHLIGILGESPFVSKLRKAESAQHSVHHTRGRPRVFRHGSSFEVFRFDSESMLPPIAANANRWAFASLFVSSLVHP